MSLYLVHKRTHDNASVAWSGTAFIVEAVLLLVFLAASAAIFVQLFTTATSQAQESLALSRAVAVAQRQAELFAADPHGIEAESDADGLRVAVDIDEDPHENGVLYYARICVYRADSADAEPLYTIETARFEKEARDDID